MKHMLQFLCYFALSDVIYAIISDKNDTELQFVQAVFRHGDRAPIHLYPTDPNSEDVWIEGLGKLTQLGRQQQYALGKYLHKMYRNFITTSPVEVDVQSSDVDRCIRSAEANLASFYAPDSKWIFNKDIKWQPIPIDFIPKDEDKYLEASSYCPAAFKEQERILKSSEGQAFIHKYQEMFDNMTANSGEPITDWTSASHLYDVLLIEKKYNHTIPAWAEPYWDTMQYVSDMSFYWSFKTKLMQRLRAGPLLGLLVDKMKQKAGGNLPNKKVQIYSTHDCNVAVLLGALNLFNMKQPPYCATLLIELHKANDTFMVRLLYLNSSTPETEYQIPHVLKLEGCTDFCPLEFFANYTKSLIPSNWEAECGIPEKQFGDFSKPAIITISCLSVVILLMLIGGACLLWRTRFQGRDNYPYHLVPSVTN